jgi:hypothetical protein
MNAEEMARNLTAEGIMSIIRHANRCMSELDRLNAELGSVGMEPRSKAKAMMSQKLETAKSALSKITNS